MTAVGYISDTEEIINASWTNFKHDGAAAFKLSERSTQPPALPAKYLLQGRTQILNAGRINEIDCHPVETDENWAPKSISHTKNWLNWKCDMDNTNESEEDWKADD